MQRKGHLVRVESLFAKLAPSEQKVAMAILKDPTLVIEAGINEIADKSGASEAAVVRFCKKAGFDGFKQFKVAMAQELGSMPMTGSGSRLDEQIKGYGTIGELVQNVIEFDVSVLKDALNTVDRIQLAGAAEALSKAKKVVIFASGLSTTVANELNNRLMRFGFETQLEGSTYAQILQASKLTPDDVAVGISYSGTTKDVVDAVTFSKQSGAKVIALTNYPDMPLAQKADFVISSNIELSPIDIGMWSMPRIVGLALVDMLMATVAFTLKGGIEGEAEASRQALLARFGINS